MASRQEAMALPHHKVQASKAYTPSPGMQAALMGLSQEGTWQSINTQGVRRQKERAHSAKAESNHQPVGCGCVD